MSINFSENFLKNLFKILIKFYLRTAQVLVAVYSKFPEDFLLYIEFLRIFLTVLQSFIDILSSFLQIPQIVFQRFTQSLHKVTVEICPSFHYVLLKNFLASFRSVFKFFFDTQIIFVKKSIYKFLILILYFDL